MVILSQILWLPKARTAGYPLNHVSAVKGESGNITFWIHKRAAKPDKGLDLLALVLQDARICLRGNEAEVNRKNAAGSLKTITCMKSIPGSNSSIFFLIDYYYMTATRTRATATAMPIKLREDAILVPHPSR